MSEAWVVNASPLILFARIGRLDLIERLAPTILIPNAVIREVRAGQQKDRTAATALKWAEQYGVEDVALVPTIEHWDLGPGESQVIAHSLGRPRWAVLDDRAARRCAVAQGIPACSSIAGRRASGFLQVSLLNVPRYRQPDIRPTSRAAALPMSASDLSRVMLC